MKAKGSFSFYFFQVAPISILLSHCDNMWTRTVSKDCHTSQEKSRFNLLSHERTSYCLPLRRNFSSEDIGILLLGSLKVRDVTSM